MFTPATCSVVSDVIRRRDPTINSTIVSTGTSPKSFWLSFTSVRVDDNADKRENKYTRSKIV